MCDGSTRRYTLSDKSVPGSYPLIRLKIFLIRLLWERSHTIFLFDQLHYDQRIHIFPRTSSLPWDRAKCLKISSPSPSSSLFFVKLSKPLSSSPFSLVSPNKLSVETQTSSNAQKNPEPLEKKMLQTANLLSMMLFNADVFYEK